MWRTADLLFIYFFFLCFTDEFKSTSATEALKVTFEPSLISPPMPSEILKELANPYRRS
jgi:hypothetical protein